MEEDQISRLKRNEKAQQKLQGKIDQMTKMMAKTTKGKDVAENHGSQKGHARQNSKEYPLHSPEFTHHYAQIS